MVSSATKIIQAAVVDTIKKKHQLRYWQIAETIGVHPTHIQKVSKGERLLSEEKFAQICKIWGINVDEVTKKMELDDLEYMRWKTLTMVLQAKEINLDDLAKKTGISFLDLNHIERGKRPATAEEIKKISEAINIDSQIIHEGTVAIVFEMIQQGLKHIHIQPSAIEAVLKFVESEL